MNPGTSKNFHEEDPVEEELFDSHSSDIAQEAFQKLLIDQRKRDSIARQKASRAVISKRRLHGAQGTEVDWEERQLCIPSGHHCGDIHSNSYVQVKKPLTELIENPSGSRKFLPFLGAGYERIPQNGKLKSTYGLSLVEDIMSYNHQDNDPFFQVNHSNPPKVAIKRVSSDETLNELLGQGINKHVLGLSRSAHKGIKYRKSRENLEIRRRHYSMGSSVTSEEHVYHPRRMMWRKFSNYQLGFNGSNEDMIQDDSFPQDLVSYDDDKELIQEKRVRRSSVGDMSFVKEDFQNGDSNLISDHSIPSKYVVVNAAKLFMSEDFPTHFSSGEFGYFSKANQFREELWGSGYKSPLCKPKYPVNGIVDQCSIGKWSEISDIRNGLSFVGEGLSCKVSANMMPNIYPPRWDESDLLQTLSFAKPLGQLKMSPIYQSHTSAILGRKSSSDFPIRKWTHQRCLPKIPQLWKEGKNLSSGDAIKETEEEMEPLSTSTDMVVIESDDVSAVTAPENGGIGDKESEDEINKDECSFQTKEQNTVYAEEPSLEKHLYEPSFLPLRLSLFPYVPPYISFASHDKKGPPVHEDIKNIAKWKLGKFTPTIVQIIVKNTGLDTVRSCDEYVGIWAKNLSPSGFAHIKESQKINHIPGGFYIGRKDSLCNNLKKMKNVYGNVEYYFVPETYVLPGDIYFLKQEWDEAIGKKEETKWIVKPPAGARGTGVSVIHNWNQIPHSKPIIVQKYIENPYLIDMTKFDLRVYVLITSVHPLRMYVYSEGLVRFASDTYSPDTSTLSDKYVHLTNYSVNKKSSRYMVNQDPTACQGHKWTLSSLWNYLKARRVNVDGLWKQIVDIAIKTFLSGESAITRCTNTYLNSNYPSYELFGLDILLDADLKPWLLEVNISPSLNTSSKLDMSVKGPMISELLNLVGYHLPPTSILTPMEKRDIVKLLMSGQSSEHSVQSDTKISNPHPGLLFDKRIYTKALSSEEKRKHLAYNDMFSNQDPYCDSILRILMPDDVRHLLTAEDELSQMDRFERVFPAVGMQKYYKFFSGPRYYNMLYEAWEKRYHMDRTAGIELLQELCRNRLHLRTPLSMSSLKFGAKSKHSRDVLAQRKLKEKHCQRKSNQESVTKKNTKRISVKTKKHSDSSSNYSSSSAKELGVKPHKSRSLKIVKVREVAASFKFCSSRSQIKLSSHLIKMPRRIPVAVPPLQLNLSSCLQMKNLYVREAKSNSNIMAM